MGSLFKNLKKPIVFTRFWVQRPPKRHPKSFKRPVQNLPRKITKNACLVKNALSRRSHFDLILDPSLAPQVCTFVLTFFTYFFLPLFRKMLKLILEPILGSERPKRAKMSPKEPSGAPKNQKPSFSKTLKNHLVF